MTADLSGLADPAFRAAANKKLRRAGKLRDELFARTHSWWESAPVALGTELLPDERTVELIMSVSPMPQVDDWWDHANDVLQNLRNALDRFHHAVCVRSNEPGWDGRVYFPITKDAKSWQQWTKQHGFLSPDLHRRYFAFQPWRSGRPMLRDLARITNLEKHAAGVKASISLTAMEMRGTTTLEGLWDDDNLGSVLTLDAGETNAIVAERQVLGTIRYNTRVIDLGDLQTIPTFTFEPLIHFDDQEIPVLRGIDMMAHEVMWSVAYISGLVESAAEPPKHFDL